MGPRNDAPEFSLRDLMETMKRRKWIIIQAFVFVTLIGAVTAALSPPVFATSAKLLVDAPGAFIPLVSIDSSSPLSPLSQMRTQRNMDTQLAILQSAPFRERVSKSEFNESKGVPVSLMYQPQEKTHIILIQAEGTDPKAVKDWAFAAGKEYIKLTEETNTDQTGRALEVARQRLKATEEKLVKTERELLAFQVRNKFDQDANVRGATVEQAFEWARQLRDARTELVEANTRIGFVKEQLEHEPPIINQDRYSINPEAEAMRVQISMLKAEKAKLLGRYQPTSERIVSINDEIQSLEEERAKLPPTIKETIEAPNPALGKLQEQLAALEQQRNAAQSKVKTLEGQTVKQTQQVENFAPAQVEFDRLSRTVDQLAKQAEEYRKLEADLTIRLEAKQGNSVQILEQPYQPSQPVKPAKAQQVALAMVMGLLLGVGFAFLQEFLDDRVNTSDDVERVAALPTLGVVPTIQDSSHRLLIGQDAFSPITESYRSLRTAVQYSHVDHRLALIGVTSAHPGEGKSVTSANLGIAIALQGKRVILVDADLRRPSVHRMFRMEAEPGLTSVLAGETTLEEALRPTAIEGFQVLPSGPLPPNPPELLNSQVMVDLLEKMREVADVIIFDTPPVIPVTDAQVLGPHLDGMVMVVETGQARKAAVRHARELLDRTRVRVLGVVLNKIDQSGKGYYYHYYQRSGYGKRRKDRGYGYGQSYGYGYGYGYGADGAYGRRGGKLGGGPEDPQTPEPVAPRLPEKLRDWD